jgi:hypothetical protein
MTIASTGTPSIRERLERLRPAVVEVAQRYGASNLRVFGSVALNQEHEDSDLDLLVDLPANQSLLPGGCGRARFASSSDSLGDPAASCGSVNKDRLYLESIRDCLERIAEYTESGEDAFLASRLIQDGVIRNLEVIGEATKNISEDLRA